MNGQQVLPSISQLLTISQPSSESSNNTNNTSPPPQQQNILNNRSNSNYGNNSTPTVTPVPKRFITLPPLVPSMNLNSNVDVGVQINNNATTTAAAPSSNNVNTQIPSPSPAQGPFIQKHFSNSANLLIANDSNSILNTPPPTRSSSSSSTTGPMMMNTQQHPHHPLQNSQPHPQYTQVPQTQPHLHPQHINININKQIAAANAVASLNMNNQVPSPSTPSVKAKRPDVFTPLSAAAKAIITPCTNDKKRAFAFITHSQETFPKREPKIDNAPLARRKRRRTSTHELNILQNEFQICPTPTKNRRCELAQVCNMSEKAVQIWFQNKRQSVKRHNKQHLSSSNLSNKSMDESLENSDDHSNSNNSTPLQPTTPSSNKRIVNSNTSKSSPNHTIKIIGNKNDLEKNKENIEISPSRTPGKRSQALTFHLKSDMKILTPIKTSPNTRVNKLINGSNPSVNFNVNTGNNEAMDNENNLTPTKRRGKVLADLGNRIQ
ncbi:hypothetical protein TBLA_0E02960 [Henningerozyma blattae CBS 6284]|uniref:Homeobox domain-containing protein n=1 Tax=Henningerozyma blattae (strain ATCC 34711 / CBS 6284 / DSM 70876 / NBRC 10599 / NRRL Y-10934 / UCD 77-7) TaxID=1071380 RepID=I2H4P8_HENB6|nr:hypothetical protein TBLA_0E02960 [Tetrapisispora blattae CBS 6284]CCH61350.1 hypothetical protein TBLA_0E02960 [Tetrapisispora blattae CBS 6284]